MNDNVKKYALIFNEALSREITLMSDAAKAPARGGAWVATNKLKARQLESLLNPNINLILGQWEGYELALVVDIPEGSEIIASGAIDTKLLKSNLLKALNKEGKPADFGIRPIVRHSKPEAEPQAPPQGRQTTPPPPTSPTPKQQPKKVNYENMVNIQVDDKVWKLAASGISWERVRDIAKEGGNGYDKDSKSWKGYTPQTATATARNNGVALVNGSGLTIIFEDTSQQHGTADTFDRGSKGKAQDIRPYKLSPADINLYNKDSAGDMTRHNIYYDYDISTIETMLIHLINETNGKVAGKLDKIHGEGENKTVTIYATGKKGDYGSLTIDEGISILMKAASYGVNPVDDLDYWIQSVNKDSDYVALTISLSYKKLVQCARLQFKAIHDDAILAFPDREMTIDEKKQHQVTKECGWVTDLVCYAHNQKITLATGYGKMPYQDFAAGRASTFYAVKASLVDAINKAGLSPDAQILKQAMFKLTGESYGEFNNFSVEAGRGSGVKNLLLPEPKEDDFAEMDRKRSKVKVRATKAGPLPDGFFDGGE